MSMTINSPESSALWLKRYYAVRALFSGLWVALAFTVGKTQPPLGLVLIIAYPLWDCLANYTDATRNGGLRANPTQLLNVVVSAIVTLAIVAFAIVAGASHDFHAVIAVIGIWAGFSGILQLATAIRRRRSTSAQWPMILSGGQSALAGVHFVMQALDPSARLSVADVAPYAAFGALYFAISAIVLAFKRR
jgi:uncharacterized membrane protein HdeD (DUF308 family)